jgi:hypothetical protein
MEEYNGIKNFPVTMTSIVWHGYIVYERAKDECGQDGNGRLYDVL